MKTNKHVLTVLFSLLLFSVRGFSQTGYFNNIYNFYNNSIVGISIAKEDTTYVVVSFSLDSLSYSRINFSRFDAEGNLLYKKDYGDGLRDYFPGHPGSLQKTSDGGFIVSGAIADTIGATALLLKVD